MKLTEALTLAFRCGLASLDLAPRVRRAIAPLALGASRVRIVAIGKAAPAMLDAAIACLDHRVEAALLIAPDGTPLGDRAADLRVEVHRAAHPIPDQRSLRSATRALEIVGTPHGLTVALISGGASSLVAAPRGVSFEAKLAVSRALLAGGATISEINTARRHLSRIKGGGLARAAVSSGVVTLLASDVIGGGPHDIGSGPTLADPTTCEHARRVLARYGALVPLSETLKPWERLSRRLRSRVVIAPADLARAVADALKPHGLTPRLGDAASRPLESFVAEYAAVARELAPGEALVRAAEPTLQVTPARPGRGGRSGHLAAVLAAYLPSDVAFLAGASDGVDGTSEAGGAVVDASFPCGERTRAALDAFDSAALHEEAGTRLLLGPTGHNVADVHILARAPR